ncbi:uncharacterized protein LOC141591080 [Silene latifolia]|uniref:uncharacterized protein LOC141591080 n=1 Tax=Silene latifolia TaxID=37657 RepID=UPI003D778E30
MAKRRQKQVSESDQSDEPESDDGVEPQSNTNLSTQEREHKKVQAKIKQMEGANLAAKDWTMDVLMMYKGLLNCHLQHLKNGRSWTIIRARRVLLIFMRKNMLSKLVLLLHPFT